MKFSKLSKYKSRPIIIDGFSGSGKILISELLKSFTNAEITKWELAFDYLPILYSFETIEKEAAQSTLRTIFDEVTYTISIGRELNYRRKDLLFAFNHPKRFRYLKSMFSKELNDSFIINKLAPTMNIPFLVHMSTFNNYLLEETFAKDLKIFYTLRDPLYILETYSSYLDRINTDPREFTPKQLYKGIDLPWYSNGWEEEYLSINNTEKSIILIDKCFELLKLKLAKKFNNSQYKLIFFEDIILDTDQKFEEIAKFLDLEFSRKVLKNIKIKNKLPRKNTQVVEGFWKRYTTNGVSRNGENEEAILDRTKGLINDYYFKKLLNLRGEYFAFKNKTS